MDDDRYVNRFTPRRAGSSYSQLNRERLSRVAEQSKLHPAVATNLRDVLSDSLTISPDVRDELRAREAWAFFASTADSYQRIRAAHVDAARGQPDEFSNRLATIVERCAERREFGSGIDDFL